MRGDLPPAAFRLLNTLPVRTHVAPDRTPRQSAVIGFGRGNGQANIKPLRVNGVVYPSINAAIRDLRISFDALKRLIRNGQAEYV